MPKKQASKEPKTGKLDWLDSRTHQESQPETDAEALRELGWWLLPSNGPVPEVTK